MLEVEKMKQYKTKIKSPAKLLAKEEKTRKEAYNRLVAILEDLNRIVFHQREIHRKSKTTMNGIKQLSAGKQN